MKELHLAIESGLKMFGWAVCYHNLKRELSKIVKLVDLNEVKRLQQGKHPGTAFHSLTTLEFNTGFEARFDRNFGYTFFEAELLREYLPKSNDYDMVFGGSTWCCDKMREHGITHTALLIQGVDVSQFYPIPRRKKRDTFRIFSGGKFEFRKGQDIVIAAFKALQEKYKDLELVTCWFNAWDDSMDTMKLSKFITYPQGISTLNWEDKMGYILAQNTIFPNRVEVHGPLPQSAMNKVMNDTDIGIFPNRCEGGTNLVMMEYMATGKPVIATDFSGHADILTPQNSYIVEKKKPMQIVAYKNLRFNWIEPDLEELIAAIEYAYIYRDQIAEIGRLGMLDIKRNFTWGHTARTLLSYIGKDTNGCERFVPTLQVGFREELFGLFNDMGLNGSGAEVGVQKGEFSEYIVKRWKGERIHLIDRWSKAEDYIDIANVSDEEHLKNFQHVIRSFSHDNRVCIMKEESSYAATLFPDEYFDWVYLDADHSYDGCRRDLLAWYPKLKKGGIFCGHDYLDEKNEHGVFGVRSAVSEFIAGKNVKLYVTKEEQWPSWYFLKT